MPAIGASTTGGPTRRDPRTSSWGTTGAVDDMGPIVPSGLPTTQIPGCGADLAAVLLVALLRALALLRASVLLRLRLRRGDVTGPLDRVELLVRPEADRLHRPLVRGEEDQAGGEGVLGLEPLRQRVGRAAVERR